MSIFLKPIYREKQSDNNDFEWHDLKSQHDIILRSSKTEILIISEIKNPN